MKLITALGLDLRILLAQLVNFAILVFVLWRFAYKPVFSILEERRHKINKGIKDSEEAGLRLSEAEEHKKKVVAEARQEANEIIEEAKKKAEIRYQEIIAKSRADIQLIIEDEKAKIATERSNAIRDIKAGATEMISLALSRVLEEKLDEKKDAELIARAVKKLN